MNGTARVNVVSGQNRRTEIKAAVNIWRQVTRIRGPPIGDRIVCKAEKAKVNKYKLLKKRL